MTGPLQRANAATQEQVVPKQGVLEAPLTHNCNQSQSTGTGKVRGREELGEDAESAVWGHSSNYDTNE